MKPEQINMFADSVQELADGPRVTSFQELTEGLMRRLAEKGATLEQLCDRKMMNRSRRTLEKKCREFGIWRINNSTLVLTVLLKCGVVILSE